MTKHEQKPSLIIVMGVSGSGKSTLAKALHNAFPKMRLFEADDFHSPEARLRMASGLPLDDTWREPWIRRMEQALLEEPKQASILAYSGLRKAHRQRFRQLGYRCCFLHLYLDKKALQDRLESRADHFMPANLLDTQLNSMEPTADESDVIGLECKQALDTLLTESLAVLYAKELLPTPVYGTDLLTKVES